MQKGLHMGKIVIKIPEAPSSLSVEPSRRPFRLKSDASYLLVGGLGGIGQAVSRWMSDRGARYFIFLSRSAGQSAEHTELVSELEALGGHVKVIAGNVSIFSDVERAVASSEKPIAGVINLSMALKVSLLGTS
jgi:NAD(P)-dependent dehydrogenase (short-subunit alcohol dehydrogenase family)